MLHSSCTEMTPSLCNSLCTPSPLETVGVHHLCSSLKTVLWQRFGLPIDAVYLLTYFCLFIKSVFLSKSHSGCIPCKMCFIPGPGQTVHTDTPCTAHRLLKQSALSNLASCDSELYSALRWVLNNFRLLFFPFQFSLCSLYQKHKPFFSGTLGYFFEERLRWCPDIHLIPGPVDQEGKNSADKTKASVLELRREYF